MLRRSLRICFSFALLGLSACSGSAVPASPQPAASTTPAEATPSPPPPAASAAASSTRAAPPAPAADTATPVDEAPKPPAASTIHKAVLADQIKGTPLAILSVMDFAAATCGAKPAEGSTMMELSLYWKPGTYVIGTRTKTASIRARQFEGGKWKTLPDVVKGEVHVIEAPVEPGKTGRVHVTFDRAGQTIDEELDVVVCVPVGTSKAN